MTKPAIMSDLQGVAIVQFARRTDWELSPNAISGILEDFKKRSELIWDLTQSNPTVCAFEYPLHELLPKLGDMQSSTYAPTSKGLLSARQAIVEYYQGQNIAISPEQIFLTASTSEAYSFLFRLLANPGETVLFPCPSYPLFDFLVDLNDLEQGFYPLVYDGRWAVDLGELQNTISSRTKAIVVVNPNNPTGSYVTDHELKKLNVLCQENDLALISDEVFFDYAFDAEKSYVSFASNTQNLTFTLGGLSKTLGLPQMKLSWILVTGPKSIVDEAIARLEIIADTYLSVNTPVQNALASWLSFRPLIQEQIKKRVRANREFLLKSFAGETLGSVLQADGGWYMILKLFGAIDEEKITQELLMQDKVYVHPGYFFNFSQEPYLILSLLPREDIFCEGVGRIAARLRNLL